MRTIKGNVGGDSSRKITAANLVLVVVLELGLDEQAPCADGGGNCGDDVAELSLIAKLARACSNLEGHRRGELDK